MKCSLSRFRRSIRPGDKKATIAADAASSAHVNCLKTSKWSTDAIANGSEKPTQLFELRDVPVAMTRSLTGWFFSEIEKDLTHHSPPSPGVNSGGTGKRMSPAVAVSISMVTRLSYCPGYPAIRIANRGTALYPLVWPNVAPGPAAAQDP